MLPHELQDLFCKVLFGLFALCLLTLGKVRASEVVHLSMTNEIGQSSSHNSL